MDLKDKKISVSAQALFELLQALLRGSHCIRELQATMNPDLFPDNPITILVDEFNEWQTSQPKPEPKEGAPE